MSPADIVRHIQFDPILEQITIGQVYNLKARYNQNILGNVKVNLMEFIDICKSMQSIPTDLDEVFVIGISYKVNKNNKIKHLRVVFTTLRLLKLAMKNKLIASDGTYKLNWNGLPVALTGTVDMAKKFHPIVLMVTKREKAKDYAFMFSTIVCKMELLFNYNYEPNTLLGDYAGAITNGFIICFGYAPEYRIICWAHCLRKFEEYTKVITDKVTKGLVYDDLYLLQTSQSTQIFREAKRLFLKKWSSNKSVTNCLKSFFKVWGKPDTENWYEGYHPLGCVPSHNNALESSNNVVKPDGLRRSQRTKKN